MISFLLHGIFPLLLISLAFIRELINEWNEIEIEMNEMEWKINTWNGIKLSYLDIKKKKWIEGR